MKTGRVVPPQVMTHFTGLKMWVQKLNVPAALFNLVFPKWVDVMVPEFPTGQHEEQHIVHFRCTDHEVLC